MRYSLTTHEFSEKGALPEVAIGAKAYDARTNWLEIVLGELEVTAFFRSGYDLYDTMSRLNAALVAQMGLLARPLPDPDPAQHIERLPA